MTKPESKTLIFYKDAPNDEQVELGVITLNGVKLVKCSQYIDVRDDKDQLVATLTWKSTVKVREV